MATSKLREFLKSLRSEEFTTPSHITYGTAIFERSAVEIISETDTAVEAWAGGLEGKVIAGGGSRRRVRLWLNNDTLHWHCAGNPKDHDIFCKHCIAVALYLKPRG